MSEVTLEELQSHRKQLKDVVARAQMATKLASNKEFKTLIMEEFCVQECARYAQASSDPKLRPEERADSLAISQAAGHLRRWLNVVQQMGTSATASLEEIEEMIVEHMRGDDAGAEEVTDA